MGGANNTESRVLEEVAAEGESRINGSLIASADERACTRSKLHYADSEKRTSKNHGMTRIEARRRKVIVKVGGAEARKTVEMVLDPLPHVSLTK